MSTLSEENPFADGTMKVAEAVKFSGISRSRLYELMNEGHLQWSKVGGTRLIARRSLVELITHGVKDH
jgi:predicted DNA-binding transcriptional regulator AlpA